MTQIEKMLALIVERPGITTLEIAEQLELDEATDVSTPLGKYVASGKVLVEKKKREGLAPVNAYFPSQELVREHKDGGVRTLPRGGYRPRPSVDEGTFKFGLFSDGGLSIVKGRSTVLLTPAESSALIEFLDSINIDKIAGASSGA